VLLGNEFFRKRLRRQVLPTATSPITMTERGKKLRLRKGLTFVEMIGEVVGVYHFRLLLIIKALSLNTNNTERQLTGTC
jgi:hypothetical protein